jgi:hypothetical protein
MGGTATMQSRWHGALGAVATVTAEGGGDGFFACLDEGEGIPYWTGSLVGHGAKWAEMGCSG